MILKRINGRKLDQYQYSKEIIFFKTRAVSEKIQVSSIIQGLMAVGIVTRGLIFGYMKKRLIIQAFILSCGGSWI